MSQLELDALERAHQLFLGSPHSTELGLDAGTAHYRELPHPNRELSTEATSEPYVHAARRSHVALVSAGRTDTALAGIVAGAHRDRVSARMRTGHLVNEARADAAVTPATPLAQREALRRRVARMRAQRAHVLTARTQALRHLAALRALRYRASRHRRVHLPPASGRAGAAVRAALSRLGRPYVWGATGPDRFDCSGLVQWAYAQAGVHLDRTTYQQINDGVPVPRSHIRPGDLVFPHAGHVQLAIGNNLVVEAPYSGASVRISRLGDNVQIRRPL
jgi:cell wall-associated NlpC family hydrolase